MYAFGFIHLDGGLAEQRRQFTRRRAARQIHFKEALLRVDKAQRPHRIQSRRSIDGDRSLRVTRDVDRRSDAVDELGAIERC